MGNENEGHTVEYYSAVKKDETMNSAGKRKELERIILSKVIQIKKDKHCMLSFSEGSDSKSSDVNT